jgi:hypothetical protein
MYRINQLNDGFDVGLRLFADPVETTRATNGGMERP